MRTTLTLDDDVVALIETERARTGQSFRTVVNRLLRRSAQGGGSAPAPQLPKLPGRPLVDISDTSAVLAELDEERRVARRLV